MNPPAFPAAFPAAFFSAAGLNRQHVFAVAALPDGLRAALRPAPEERQLILLGHAGRQLWECVRAADGGGAHPIDEHCRRTIARAFAERLPGHRYRLLYPGDGAVDLQTLGKLAGWHHGSPFMVGVDAQWGSWFAYRAVFLCDTDFAPTPSAETRSPCPDCRERPCLAACPAQAAGDPFHLDRCIEQRLAPASPCAYACPARNACPAGRQHRYDDAQIRHAYAQSLQTLRQWRRAG